jgi:Fe-S cluster assembly iron-binding protein IscA
MHWKLLLGLFIIIGIAGLLMFSERGRNFREKYLDKYVKPIGSYLKGITGRFVKQKPINRTLDITLETDFFAVYGQEFEIEENALDFKFVYDTVSIDDQSINLRGDKTIEFKTDSMSGSFIIDGDGRVRVYGEASSIEINDLIFTPEAKEGKIEFSLVGSPTSFSLFDVEKSSMTLSGISGTLKFEDWSPLALENDDFFVQNFKGNIKLDEGSLIISGKVEKARLNGIDLSLRI